MANFSDLPTEIQLLVAQDLSESHLFGLKSLSSLFLNCWMDTRWKSVIVDLRTPDSVVCLLQRVVDPFVATRLKMLAIDLDQRQFFPCTIPPKPEFDGAVTLLLDCLLDCLPLLPNITCLDVEGYQNFTFDVATFFQRISSFSFARKLQRLILSGLVGTLMPLWECSVHNTPFGSLTRLDLYLDDCDDNAIMPTKFCPSLEHFLRSLAPTLQYLYIWTTIDLSLLFNAFVRPLSLSQSHSPVPFPNLTSLSLHLFETSWRDPRSLRHFLLALNNLQNFYLNIRNLNPEAERLLGTLLTELVNHNNQLPSFQTLDIYPSATQAGLSALLTLIKRSAPTLSSLVISVRYLTEEESIQVVDALAEGKVQFPGTPTTTTTTTTPEEPRKLKSLDMSINFLSVHFLDLLARKLPQLETLSLRIKHIIGSPQHSFHDQLECRRYDPDTTCSQDVLHAWRLQGFSIDWDRRDMIDLKRAERAVAGAVAALARRMEWGDGYLTIQARAIHNNQVWSF